MIILKDTQKLHEMLTKHWANGGDCIPFSLPVTGGWKGGSHKEYLAGGAYAAEMARIVENNCEIENKQVILFDAGEKYILYVLHTDDHTIAKKRVEACIHTVFQS